MYFYSNRRGAVIILLVIVTSNFPHCTSHIASLFNSGGGLPTPNHKSNGAQVLSHITRVSRDPKIKTDYEEDLGLSSSRANFLTSPIHHTRYRSRLSQPHSHHHSPGVQEESSNENNNDGQLYSLGLGLTPNFSDSPTDDQHFLSDEDNPAFTPFISARALTNMGKFFEHLQENLLAMQQERLQQERTGGGSLEIGQPERRRMTSESTDSVAGDNGDSSSQENDGSREGSGGVTMALRWQPPASGVYRSEPSPSPMISQLSLSENSRIGGNSRGRQKMQNFFQTPSEDESLLRRANNYNPSWLFTGLGLGKRRRR